MKSASLLIVSYIFISLVLCHVQEVEAQKTKCTDSQVFGGVCAFNRNQGCIADFARDFKKKAWECECINTVHNAHLCRCKVC
nr:S-locus cysteine-rich protein haplogroup D [Arabidopsis halleri]BCK74192.1 MALE1 [Binary vector pFAST-G01-Male1]